MQILVTGGSGFLGLEIVKQLLALHHQVISINRNFSKSLHDLGVVQHLVDLSDLKLLHPLQSVGKVDAVFHNAAKAGVWGNYGQYFSSNFIATKNILDWSLLHGVKHFIYTSTPSVVYGESPLENADETLPYPEKYLSAYAQTKAMAEKLVLQSHKPGTFQTVAIRPHLIWGKDDPHLIPRLVQRAKCGRLIQVGNGHNLVDIIHVTNAAHAHLCALEYLQAQPQNGGNAYFVGQERPIPLWWFIHIISQQLIGRSVIGYF